VVRQERGRDHGGPQRLRTSCGAIFSRAQASIRASRSSRTRPAAQRRCLAVGIGIARAIVPDQFRHEVFSDLTGERGVLMGALAASWKRNTTCFALTSTASEAFNETVEELTQSSSGWWTKNGMDWMYSNCSATAQRGAWTGSALQESRAAGLQGAL